MRDDFAAFILTNGRPDKVHTYKYLREAGYTGRIFIVIDDEDQTASAYRARYGDEVLMFSKAEIAKTFDEGDNFGDRRAIVYARHACFDLAERVGCRYFIQLDDDYTSFWYRWSTRRVYGQWRVRTTMDEALSALLDYYIAIPAASIAMSQGGDHIGGGGDRGGGRGRDIVAKRKCMNSFICSTDRRFQFYGKQNEDVSTYTSAARRGVLFLTIPGIQLNQLATQANSGGMSEAYRESGTYVKSFYSVMYAPSAVRVSTLSDPRSPHVRVHHVVDWDRAAPCILREEHRKASASPKAGS